MRGMTTSAGTRGRARLSRRGLAVCLGVLWLADGALQLQPVMFTRTFATGIIAPAGQGQPGPVHWVVNLAASAIGTHPGAYNAAFAGIQLALGLALLWRRTAPLALAGSVAWALGVWITGEGVGGILGGQTGMLGGFPGAALLYAVLAVAAWPGLRAGADRLPPARWLRPAWALLWGAAAIVQVLPGQLGGSAVSGALTNSLSGVPGPLASASRLLAGQSGSGIWPSVVLAVLFAGIGTLALLPGRPGPAVAAIAGIAAAAGIWLLAEGFGGLGTGSATDPNTGPLLILFAAAMWSAARGLRHRAGSAPPDRHTASPAAPRSEREPAVVLAGAPSTTQIPSRGRNR
jgi:hypothetical protein